MKEKPSRTVFKTGTILAFIRACIKIMQLFLKFHTEGVPLKGDFQRFTKMETLL